MSQQQRLAQLRRLFGVVEERSRGAGFRACLFERSEFAGPASFANAGEYRSAAALPPLFRIACGDRGEATDDVGGAAASAAAEELHEVNYRGRQGIRAALVD